ncbi:neuropeptide CCHamide-2 receptor-like [Dendronephthya gigantea]|uniref:neuropeptide CCHamide-2 receptor-like n=1 Tax=Dendronephthya gigantea TaxID=151771 RepID=UPI001069619D|nr:neuropeptide CCHamide-2 receptor-like [Dendronephthya gigantea]
MKYNITVPARGNISTPGSIEFLEHTLLMQLVVLSTLAVLGVVGNIIIIVTGLRRLCLSDLRLRQEYKTSFITNLAVADILILIYCVPLHLTQEKGLPMSEFVCRYLVPLRDVLVLASILTIMAISLERAVAIINPFSLESSQRHTKYWITLIWIVAYLLAGLPMAFVMTSNGKYCLPKWSTVKLMNAHKTSAVLFIILPGIITTLSYIFCVRSLRKFRRRRENSNESTGVQRWSFIKQTQSVSRIAVVLVAVFWACNLPLVIYMLTANYQLITPSLEEHTYSWTVLVILFFSASMLNPIVLIALSPLYRKSASTCVRFIFTRGNPIARYRSRAQYTKETINRSEHISIANNEYGGENNNASEFALTARKQSCAE